MTCWNNRELGKKIISLGLKLYQIIGFIWGGRHGIYWLGTKQHWRRLKGLKTTFQEGEKHQQTGNRGKRVQHQHSLPKQFNSALAVSGSLALPPRQKLKEGLERCIALLGTEPAEKATVWMNFSATVGQQGECHIYKWSKKKQIIMWRKQMGMQCFESPFILGIFLWFCKNGVAQVPLIKSPLPAEIM